MLCTSQSACSVLLLQAERGALCCRDAWHGDLRLVARVQTGTHVRVNRYAKLLPLAESIEMVDVSDCSCARRLACLLSPRWHEEAPAVSLRGGLEQAALLGSVQKPKAVDRKNLGWGGVSKERAVSVGH